MTSCLIYMTADTAETARAIGRALVDERLAACVNVLGRIASIYRWEGKVVEEGEIAFIAKTTEDLVSRLTERVRKLHPYSVPCVVSLPVSGGNAAFLDWIAAETGAPA